MSGPIIITKNPATYPGPLIPYAAGYANTDVITVTFGTVQSEGAAGSLYYKVPLAMNVHDHFEHNTDLCGLLYPAPGAASRAGHSTLPTHGHRCR